MEISKVKPDRNLIDLDDVKAMKRWTKRLGVSHEQIAEAHQKVGPSCAAIRKELGLETDANPQSATDAS